MILTAVISFRWAGSHPHTWRRVRSEGSYLSLPVVNTPAVSLTGVRLPTTNPRGLCKRSRNGGVTPGWLCCWVTPAAGSLAVSRTQPPARTPDPKSAHSSIIHPPGSSPPSPSHLPPVSACQAGRRQSVRRTYSNATLLFTTHLSMHPSIPAPAGTEPSELKRTQISSLSVIARLTMKGFQSVLTFAGFLPLMRVVIDDLMIQRHTHTLVNKHTHTHFRLWSRSQNLSGAQRALCITASD